MDAIELLTADHRAAQKLLTEARSGSGDLKGTMQTIVRELSIHAAIEEQVVYSKLQTLRGGKKLTTASLKEHKKMKELLAAIEKAGDTPTDELLSQLISAVAAHIHEEESKSFPLMRKLIPPPDLADMGDVLEKAKAISPTHPHPGAPNTPPANIVAGMGEAVIDRARDAIRRD